MENNTVRQRYAQSVPEPIPDLGAGTAGSAKEPHPAGEVKHAPWLQVARLIVLTAWFLSTSTFICFTQILGSPLYVINRDLYYAYMALTKQSFGMVVITITNWFSPTTIRISWDPSLKGQFKKKRDGKLETHFPERLVLLANHQIYTDWLYLWWLAYTSQMHGHIYIILKETLKYIPILGTGMMYFGFIFMARKWASDQSRIEHRLQKLKQKHSGPLSGSAGLDPMWLMIFPEGTNLSANTRKRSAKWADTTHIEDLKYQLLPRSTGLHFCLEQLGDTVEWIYDCTLAYEGTPPGGYAQDYFTMRSTYFQGRPPKSVNMYWRRFAVKDIPTDTKAFESWLLERWREKEEYLHQYFTTGRFPAGIAGAEEGRSEPGYINTEVRLRNWYEVGAIFVVMSASGLLFNIVRQLYNISSRRLASEV